MINAHILLFKHGKWGGLSSNWKVGIL